MTAKRGWMSPGLVAVLCVSAITVASARAGSGDWPQWRGPARDGVCVEKGLLTAWPPKGPKLRWQAENLGVGYASVAIAKGKIFTMGDRDDGLYLFAFDEDTGKEMWAKRVAGIFDHKKYPGGRCTPAVDGELLYAVGGRGDLVCLETATGNIRWQKNFVRDFAGRMMSGWGFSESPLVDGDKLLCTPGGRDATIVALNKTDGSTLWKAKVPPLGDQGREGAAYSSIVVSEACGIRQYVQLLGNGVVGIAAKDGRYLWGYNRVANRTANIPTPIPIDDYIFCSTGYQTGSALLKLSPSAEGINAEEVYFLPGKTLQNHHGGMVRVGDHIYLGHQHNAGFPTCVEWKSGKVIWQQRGPGKGSAAVVYADGHLYFRYQDGKMALVEASPKEYKLKSTFEIPNVTQPSWPHPVVTGGHLYLREWDRLYCYEVTKVK